MVLWENNRAWGCASDGIRPNFSRLPLCLFARMPAHCRCRFAGPRSRVRERNTESGTISKPMLAAEDVARPNRHATAGIWDHQVPVLLAPPWTRPAAFRHAFQVDRVDVEVDLSPEPGGWALASMRSTILRRPRYCGSPSTTRKLGSWNPQTSRSQPPTRPSPAEAGSRPTQDAGVSPTTSWLAAKRRETLHRQAPERKFVRDGLPELGAQFFVHTMRYAGHAMIRTPSAAFGEQSSGLWTASQLPDPVSADTFKRRRGTDDSGCGLRSHIATKYGYCMPPPTARMDMPHQPPTELAVFAGMASSRHRDASGQRRAGCRPRMRRAATGATPAMNHNYHTHT